MAKRIMPSQVDDKVGLFDRFAGKASNIASRAPFFAVCVLLILVWVPTLFFLDINTSQLLINTATTIITFLLVALLQNSQTRNDMATQHKLNAVASGLSDLMAYTASNKGESSRKALVVNCDELRRAVGIEQIESTT